MGYCIAFFIGYLFCSFTLNEPKKKEPPRKLFRLMEAHVYNEEGTDIEHRYKTDIQPDMYSVECSDLVHRMQERWPHRRVEFIWE